MTDTEQTTTEASPANPRKTLVEAGILLLILIIACTQWAIGGSVDKTGEQTGMSIPLATIVLSVGLLAVLYVRRELRLAKFRCPQILLLCALSIGLLGLSRSELKGGLKELIQIGEIFVISWYLFATASAEVRAKVLTGAGYVGTGLLLFGVAGLHKVLGLEEARFAGLIAISTPAVIYAWRKHMLRSSIVILLAGIILGLWLKNGGLLLVWMIVLVLAAGLLARKLLPVAAAAVLIAVGLSLVSPGTPAWDSLNPHFDQTHRKRLFVEYSASLKAPRQYPVGGGLGEYKRTVNVLKLLLNDDASGEENKIPGDSNCQYLLTMVEAGLPAALALLLLLGASVFYALKSARGNDDQNAKLLAQAVAVALIGAVMAGMFTTILGRGIGIWFGAFIGLAAAAAFPAGKTSLVSFVVRLAIPAVFGLACLAGVATINTTVDETENVSLVNNKLRAAIFGIKAETPPEPKPDDGTETTDTGLTIINLGDDDDDDQSTDGTIRAEGESYVSADGKIQIVKANDTSGNQTLEIPDKSGKGVGEAIYELEIKKAGTYLLVSRVWWEDGCSNSLGFAIDGVQHKISSARYKVWHDLTSKKSVELQPGKLTITLQNIEDGIRLDYFELRPR